MSSSKPVHPGLFIPIIGIAIFWILYVVATFYYAGGHYYNRDYPGFDWMNNYWCDLIAPIAKNGKDNPSRPIAMAAMLVLCISLSVFWFISPRLFEYQKGSKLIAYSGTSSMLIAFFIFTPFHDTVINTAGPLGIVAILATFYALYWHKNYKLLVFGACCLCMVLLNYAIYYGNFWSEYLAVIQKLAFFFFLLWIALINLVLLRKRV